MDRHNLCFAYGPSVGGGQLAGAAAGAAGAAPVLAQAALLALGLVRRGLSPLAALQLSGLAASILGLVTGATLPASKPKVTTSINYKNSFKKKKKSFLIENQTSDSSRPKRSDNGPGLHSSRIKKEARHDTYGRNDLPAFRKFRQYDNDASTESHTLSSRQSKIVSRLRQRTRSIKLFSRNYYKGLSSFIIYLRVTKKPIDLLLKLR